MTVYPLVEKPTIVYVDIVLDTQQKQRVSRNPNRDPNPHSHINPTLTVGTVCILRDGGPLCGT